MRQPKRSPSALIPGLLAAALAAATLGWYTAGLTLAPSADRLPLPGAVPVFTETLPPVAPRLRPWRSFLAVPSPAAPSLDGGAFGAEAPPGLADLPGPLFDDLSTEGCRGTVPDPLRPSLGLAANAAALAALRAAAAGSLSLDDPGSADPSPPEPKGPPGDPAAPPPLPGGGDRGERAPGALLLLTTRPVHW